MTVLMAQRERARSLQRTAAAWVSGALGRIRVAAAVAAAVFAAQLRLIVAACGLGLLSWGFALAWLPLAFIVPGGLLVIVAVGGARVEARASQDRRAR